MNRAETIIQELDTWKPKDLRLLYDALLSRLFSRDKPHSDKIGKLQKYIGIGKGVWEIDAQEHVTNLREDREL